MDRSHKLDAPDNDRLKNIEQVEDRSELSALYPDAHNEWTGEVMSEEERTSKRDQEQDNITKSIRTKFWIIGTLAPLPVVLAVVIIATLASQLDLSSNNAASIILPGILGAIVWGVISYSSFKKISNVFYQHALKATPFVTILYFMLIISAQIIYVLTNPIHGWNLLTAVTLVSLISVIWSILLSLLLLVIWTATRITNNFKLFLIVVLGFLLGAGAALTLVDRIGLIW